MDDLPVNIQKAIEHCNMAIEIVDLPIKKMIFHSFLYVYRKVYVFLDFFSASPPTDLQDLSLCIVKYLLRNIGKNGDCPYYVKIMGR